MSGSKGHSSPWRTIALFLGAGVLGLPILYLFFSVALSFLLVLGPLVLVNYLLWGWWLAPRPTPGESLQEPSREWLNQAPVPHSQGIQSKERRERLFRW